LGKNKTTNKEKCYITGKETDDLGKGGEVPEEGKDAHM